MTSKISLSIATVVATLADGAAAVSQLQVQLLDSTGAVVATQDVADAEAPTVDFTGVADGTYTAVATILDINGSAVGTAATSGPIVAPVPVVPPVTFNAPSAITATVTAE